MTSYLKMGTVQEKAMCVLWFFERNSVIKPQRRYRTQYGKYQLQIMLSDAGESNFKGLVVFCTEKEREAVGRIQEAFSRSPQKSARRASVQSGVPQTAVWRAVRSVDKKTLGVARRIHNTSSVCTYCRCSAAVTMVHICAEFVGPLGRHGRHLQSINRV
jgi:hypothetical protein